MPDNHSLYISSFVVVIVVFLLVIICGTAFYQEKFQDLSPLLPMSKKQRNEGMKNKGVIDTLVPQNLKFKDATSFYQGLDRGLDGTSLVNVSEVLSQRFPIAIETPMNWYSTQPLVGSQITLGTDDGSLPKSQCGCNATGTSI